MDEWIENKLVLHDLGLNSSSITSFMNLAKLNKVTKPCFHTYKIKNNCIPHVSFGED